MDYQKIHDAIEAVKPNTLTEDADLRRHLRILRQTAKDLLREHGADQAEPKITVEANDWISANGRIFYVSDVFEDSIFAHRVRISNGVGKFTRSRVFSIYADFDSHTPTPEELTALG